MKFNAYVCELYGVHRCQEYKDEESRGLFGFHPKTCSDCKRVFLGWEIWGENGHKQNSLTSIGGWPTPDREKFIGWIAHLAKRELGKKTPMRFHRGRMQTIYLS